MTLQAKDQSAARILEYLRKLAPYSVVDAGIRRAGEGAVTDIAKTAGSIRGSVRDESGATWSTSLKVLSSEEVDASCGCSSDEEMSEQWCPHAVALLWRASDLGFFQTDSGFASTESTYRLNTSSPIDVADVIVDISKPENAVTAPAAPYYPEVSLQLDLSGDRLGISVLFDKEIQAPNLFEDFHKRSSRALDNIIVELLDDKGSWDDVSRMWFVNSSEAIEIVLGLIQEYPKIVSRDSGKKITFARDSLDAHLVIDWTDSGARLSMGWILPDGTKVSREGDLLGTGPYWTLVDHTLYRLLPAAARIAGIFPFRGAVSFSRTQAGPILEALHEGVFDSRRIQILHAEFQPAVETKDPKPVLTLERREADSEHFASSQRICVEASLRFDYPQPPRGKNIVYLPNRDLERAASDLLKQIGFELLPDRRKYSVEGDSALDLLHQGAELFPDHWEVLGLEALRKGLRFSDLSLNVSVNSPGEEGGTKKPRKGSSLGIDWFDCHISLTQNNSNVPLSIIFKNARTDSDRWIRLDGGTYARVPGGSVSNLKTTLGMIEPNFKLSNTIKTRLSTAQAMSFSKMDERQFNIVMDQKLHDLADRLRDFSQVAPLKTSKHFVGSLRSYQADGVSWLNFLREFKCGGVLADEMGLGKTVQTLAFIQSMKDKGEISKPVLVVAPTSIITNWAYEARRFTPKLSVLLLHGSTRKKHFSEVKNHDIVITSYALLRLDRVELERMDFSYLILDEAQNIKNAQASTTRAAKALRADHRLALTGTPTENRPLELWSIMDFLMPGYLGSHDFFRTHIEKPILDGGPSVQVGKILNSKTRPFLLRRTKAEVEKDLPPKIESVLHVEMTDSQKNLYAQILNEVRPRVLEAISAKGVRGASVSILAALLRLRQVCNHPLSLPALKDLEGLDSGKFNLFRELMDEALESGRKILVFCQFLEMLSLMRKDLDEKKVPYVYLDGASRNRQDIVDQFNLDEKNRVFLISLKAGGTGLNLTAADTVIIYDPWWNPAVENQAVDRAHRIGQKKTVTVYRLVTEDSIEQKIMTLKAKKAKLVEALVNENGLSTLNLSKADLESLFAPFPEGA